MNTDELSAFRFPICSPLKTFSRRLTGSSCSSAAGASPTTAPSALRAGGPPPPGTGRGGSELGGTAFIAAEPGVCPLCLGHLIAYLVVSRKASARFGHVPSELALPAILLPAACCCPQGTDYLSGGAAGGAAHPAGLQPRDLDAGGHRCAAESLPLPCISAYLNKHMNLHTVILPRRKLQVESSAIC